MKGNRIMLTPELQKLREYLAGAHQEIDPEELLRELDALDKLNIEILLESLSAPSERCPTCGRKW